MVRSFARPLPIALALAYLAALAPIWWPHLLPLTDGPQHLASIALWHRLGDPTWGFDRFYASRPALGPNGGYYLVTHLLSYLFPVAVASKLFLSLYAAALPASVIAFARRFDRAPALALLTFPFIFGYCLGFGFIGGCAAWPALLFTLVLLDRFLATPRASRLAAYFAVAVATLLLHPLGHLLLVACALPVLLSHLRRDRRAAASVAIAAAVVAATSALAYRAMRAVAPIGRFLDGKREPLLETAAGLPHRLLIGWPGDADDLTLLALALSWVLLAATARRDERSAAATLRGWVPELCFLVAAASYVALPYEVTRPVALGQLAPRLLAPAALFGALLVRGPILGRRRFLLVPALVAAILYPLGLARHFADFDSRAAPAVRLLDRVPRGASTLTLLVGGAEDPALEAEYAPYSGFHAYAQLVAGGFDPYRVDLGGPIAARPEAALPAPPRDRPTALQPAVAAAYDFLFTHNEARDGQLAPYARLVARDGAWRLYATRGAP